MPKQIWKIEQFHGGLNSNSDPRDIADNELSTVTGLMVDEVGKIRTIGATTKHNSLNVGFNGTIQPGYGLFHFDNDYTGAGLLLPPTESPSNYIAFWDDANSEVDILENLGGTFPIVGTSKISLGGNGGKPCFYYVDGVLRVSDGDFGSANANKWFGLINRTLFVNANSYPILSWVSENQKIEIPQPSRFRNQLLETGTNYSTELNASVSNAYPNYDEADDGSLGTDNISRVTVYWEAVSSSSERSWDGSLEVKVGGFDGNVFTGESKTSTANFSSNDSTSPHNGVVVLTFDHTVPDIDVDGDAATDPKKIRARIQNVESGYGSGDVSITRVKYDSAVGTPGAHDNLTAENVEVEIKMSTPTAGSASGWGSSASVKYKWNVGVSFIYDEKQESLITELEEVYTGTQTASSDGTTPDLLTDSAATFIVDDLIGETIYNTTDNSFGTILDNSATTVSATLDEGDDDSWDNGDTYEITKTTVAAISTQSPKIKFNIKHSDSWNKRITGAKLYMRKSQADEVSDWFRQVTYDFVKGKAIVALNGQEQVVVYNASLDEYYWEIPREKLQNPSLSNSYQSETGYKYNEESIISKYKTAVVANRSVYIGGLEVQKTGGNEVIGDAMIKSPVGNFDIFPLSKIIEVSVRDGDSIVKLEEYADRILQFKKNKMHLINISQEIEFLEDTFIHKGVSHPAATCKTDFGIAWVNKHGCYLYDGQRVSNLLEKNGRQMIKESEWKDFVENSTGTSLDPMIGYIPLKRQLLVISDVGDSMNEATEPQIYLYDMVNQSWVNAEHSATVVDTVYDRNVDLDKTNFVNDWDGNLVLARETGTLRKWSDTSQGVDSGKLHLKTKDIDFGQPAQRKKVYKVYISYKGDASSVDIQYSINGDNNTTSPFYRILTDGTGDSDKTNSDTTPLYDCGTDDWVAAELKPVSSINNVKSFQLVIAGSAESDFEINDISIVYRLKGIK
jgi:hypothetical protein